MDTQELAHELLSTYGRIAGLPDLRFDAHGCARLMFGDDVAVDLEIDLSAGCLQMYGVLGPVPPGGRECLYRKLLEGNLFGTHTRGACLAIDSVQEEVVLCRRVDPGSTSPAHFSDVLESFAGHSPEFLRLRKSGWLGDREHQAEGMVCVPQSTGRASADDPLASVNFTYCTAYRAGPLPSV